MTVTVCLLATELINIDAHLTGLRSSELPSDLRCESSPTTGQRRGD